MGPAEPQHENATNASLETAPNTSLDKACEHSKKVQKSVEEEKEELQSNVATNNKKNEKVRKMTEESKSPTLPTTTSLEEDSEQAKNTLHAEEKVEQVTETSLQSSSMLEEHRGQEKEYTSDEANIPSILPSKENLAKILVKKNLLSTLDSKTDEKKSISNSNDRLCS